MATKEDDFDVRAEVNFLMLDYLICLAIERTLDAAKVLNPCPALQDEVNWTVDPVKSLRAIIARSQPESPLPHEIDVRWRMLTIAHQLWNYPDPQSLTHIADDDTPPLMNIGIEFLKMCAVAVDNVHEKRWFDVGAEFMLQSVLQELREGNTHPQALDKFRAWNPSGDELISMWTDYRERRAALIPDSTEDYAAWEALDEQFTFGYFKEMVMTFLFDLMAVLDPPILVQAELGQINGMTPEETEELKQRCGWYGPGLFW